jgi:hypothetical protein
MNLPQARNQQDTQRTGLMLCVLVWHMCKQLWTAPVAHAWHNTVPHRYPHPEQMYIGTVVRCRHISHFGWYVLQVLS